MINLSPTTFANHHEPCGILNAPFTKDELQHTINNLKNTKDVVGDKCVKADSGNLSFDNEAKKVAWKQHYERLLNEEFSWNPENLTADPVVGPHT